MAGPRLAPTLGACDHSRNASSSSAAGRRSASASWASWSQCCPRCPSCYWRQPASCAAHRAGTAGSSRIRYSAGTSPTTSKAAGPQTAGEDPGARHAVGEHPPERHPVSAGARAGRAADGDCRRGERLHPATSHRGRGRAGLLHWRGGPDRPRRVDGRGRQRQALAAAPQCPNTPDRGALPVASPGVRVPFSFRGQARGAKWARARRRHEATPTMAAVAAAVGAPDFILPWLDRFYDEDDAELMLAAANDGAAPLAGAGEERLARAVRRAILDRDEAGVYAPSDFHARLEIWAMFEGWKDVPLDVHRRLAELGRRLLRGRVRRGRPAVGPDGLIAEPTPTRRGYAYLLLHEAEDDRRGPGPRLPVALRLPLDVRALPQADQRVPALRERPRARLGDLGGARRRTSCAPPTRPG